MKKIIFIVLGVFIFYGYMNRSIPDIKIDKNSITSKPSMDVVYEKKSKQINIVSSSGNANQVSADVARTPAQKMNVELGYEEKKRLAEEKLVKNYSTRVQIIELDIPEENVPKDKWVISEITSTGKLIHSRRKSF